jgi:hypothetical protein
MVFVENTGDPEFVSYADELIRALQAAGLTVTVTGRSGTPCLQG